MTHQRDDWSRHTTTHIGKPEAVYVAERQGVRRSWCIREGVVDEADVEIRLPILGKTPEWARMLMEANGWHVARAMAPPADTRGWRTPSVKDGEYFGGVEVINPFKG